MGAGGVPGDSPGRHDAKARGQDPPEAGCCRFVRRFRCLRGARKNLVVEPFRPRLGGARRQSLAREFQEAIGILGDVLHPDFEVQMRAG